MDGGAFGPRHERRVGRVRHGAHTPRLRIVRPDIAFLRILQAAQAGEWQLRQWAAELGISEDEMLIELDRNLHQRRVA
jgi:hypothetical protein